MDSAKDLQVDAKVAIVFDAATEGVGEIVRAVHDLVAAHALQQGGATVRLLFDGPGVAWLAFFQNERDPLAQRLGALFQEMKQAGLLYEVCGRCVEVFGVREPLAAHGEPMTDGVTEHPSVTALVVEGYRIQV